MPHKPTGGKPGRPKKSVVTTPSRKQQEFIELVLAKPGRTGAHNARILGVTKQANSKWGKDPLIRKVGNRKKTVPIVAKWEERANKRELLAKNARDVHWQRLRNNLEVSIEHFVKHHWTGPTPLPGRTKPILTQEHYTQILIGMAKKGRWPADLLKLHNLFD